MNESRADKHGYGGSFGGSKSHALRLCALIRSKLFAGRRLILRRKKKELTDNHTEPLFRQFPFMRSWYNQQNSSLTLPGGKATIVFGYAQHAAKNGKGSIYDFQGSEWDDIFIDEATHFNEEELSFMSLRCRHTNGSFIPKSVWAMNPGNIGHCVPFGEVLTIDNGWVPINKVNIGQHVASLDNDETFCYVPVEQKHQHEFSGNLVKFECDTAYIECTPDHQIARRTETKHRKVNGGKRDFHEISLIKARNLSQITRIIRAAKIWQGTEIDTFEIPNYERRKSRQPQPLSLDGDQYCELMGWFLSEGHTVDIATYPTQDAIGIAQTKQPQRDRIAELLNEIGIRYRVNEQGFLWNNWSWHSYLSQFGKCRDKFVPLEIKQATPRQLRIFFDAAMAGDGHGTHYYTSSRQLADDMQEIGLKLGYSPSISSRQRDNRDGLAYDVNFRLGRDGWLEKSKEQRVPFLGTVFCIGVPGHKFFLRQNGKVWLSGNSFIKRVMIDRQYQFGEVAAEYDYLQAFGWDNVEWVRDALAAEHITPQEYYDSFTEEQRFDWFTKKSAYGRKLAALRGKLRLARLFGDWQAFAGQYFDIWDETTHVADKIDLKPWWPRWISMDWGYEHNAAIHWHAADGDRIVTYREDGGQHHSPAELAGIIKTRNCGDKISAFYLSPDAFELSGRKWSMEGTVAQQIGDALEGSGIPRPEKANNARVSGWRLMHEMLSNELWIVHSSCKRLIEQIPEMMRDEDNVEDVLKVDASEDGEGGDDYADSCFVAGTLITTKRGNIAIECVNTSDLVLTTQGWKPVLFAGQTGIKPTMRLSASNGAEIVGTADHPVWIKGAGFCRLDSVRYGDIMVSCKLKPLYGMAINTGAILIRLIQRIARILCEPLSGVGALSQSFCTAPSGLPLMGQFPPNTTFITPTRTHQTTPYQTSNALVEKIIALGIAGHSHQKDWRGWHLSALLRHNGISPKPDVNSLEPYPRSSSLIARFLTLPAIFAEVLSKARNGVDSAPISASPHGGESLALITLKRFVSFVASLLSQIATTKYAFAPVSALSLSGAGSHSVYNLTVADCPEFFANGILVHNCRYGLASRLQPARPPLSARVSGRIEDYAARRGVTPENLEVNVIANLSRKAHLLENPRIQRRFRPGRPYQG